MRAARSATHPRLPGVRAQRLCVGNSALPRCGRQSTSASHLATFCIAAPRLISRSRQATRIWYCSAVYSSARGAVASDRPCTQKSAVWSSHTLGCCTQRTSLQNRPGVALAGSARRLHNTGTGLTLRSRRTRRHQPWSLFILRSRRRAAQLRVRAQAQAPPVVVRQQGLRAAVAPARRLVQCGGRQSRSSAAHAQSR